MVVAVAVAYLFVVSIDVATNGLCGAEVERSALHLQNLSCRNACVVDRQVEVGIDFALKVVNGRSRVGYSCE